MDCHRCLDAGGASSGPALAVNIASRYDSKEGFSANFLKSAVVDLAFARIKQGTLTKGLHSQEIQFSAKVVMSGYNLAWGGALALDRYAVSRKFGL